MGFPPVVGMPLHVGGIPTSYGYSYTITYRWDSYQLGYAPTFRLDSHQLWACHHIQVGFPPAVGMPLHTGGIPTGHLLWACLHMQVGFPPVVDIPPYSGTILTNCGYASTLGWDSHQLWLHLQIPVGFPLVVGMF